MEKLSRKYCIIMLISFVLFSLTFVNADTLKTSCGILTSPNTRYYMTSDIYDYESSVCFSLDQINQTLDCQGHQINLDTAVGGLAISMPYEGGKVMNCKIDAVKTGILIEGGSTTTGIFNINITNNTFYILGDSADCIVGQGIRKTSIANMFNSEISYNTFNYLNGADSDGNRCAEESYAINLVNSNNNQIFGNTFSTTGYLNAPTYGIKLTGSNNIIKDNLISGTYYGGFVMDSHQNSSGFVYKNNTIINLTQSNSLLYGFKAISEYYQVFNSSFKNNKYSIYFGGIGADIIGGGGHSNFTNILINNSNTSIYLYSDGNGWTRFVRFKDLNIINSTDYDVYDIRNDDLNIYFLNATYNISKEYVENSYLYRQWYYSAYVNDSLGNAVSGANVLAYDNTNWLQFNISTNSTGYTNQTSIIDYVNYEGDRTYYSNYTITAIDNIGHQSSHSLNITQVNNYQDKFQLSCWSYLNKFLSIYPVCGWVDFGKILQEIFI